MTYTADYSGDHAHADGVETVTFTPQNPVGSAVTTVKALRANLSRPELAFVGGGLGIEPEWIVWILFSATLGGNTPKGGDIITDASADVWTILNLTKRPDETQWRAVCRKRVT